MNILPVNFNKYNNINFESYSTSASTLSKKLQYRTETCFMRDDLDWEEFVHYLSEKFKFKSSVNVVNHACSAGHEPYTLLLSFIKFLGKESNKFLPINARDIDKEAIENANSGILQFSWSEYKDACNNFKDVFTNNFMVNEIGTKTKYLDNQYNVTCNTDLKKLINFNQSNIFDDKDTINKDNTVLLFRNAWPYLGFEKICTLAKFLVDNMQQNSVLVIGRYDLRYNIDRILKAYGFTQLSEDNSYIYELTKNKKINKDEVMLFKQYYQSEYPYL